MSVDLPALLDRIYYRYPSLFIDAIAEHESGRRIVGIKNVTSNEEFFQGHFPGSPLMPAVLTIEALTQVAAALILERESASPTTRVWLRGVNEAKFRRHVVPGDRLRLEVTIGRIRPPLATVQAQATVDGQLVAEAELLLGIEPGAAFIAPSALRTGSSRPASWRRRSGRRRSGRSWPSSRAASCTAITPSGRAERPARSWPWPPGTSSPAVPTAPRRSPPARRRAPDARTWRGSPTGSS